MKTIKLSILLLFACTLAIAQSSLNSITLTNAITDTNTEQITLSSMAAVNVGDLLFVDREAMKVVRVGLVTVSVVRGSNTRAATHAAGATVLSGSPSLFFSFDPPSGGPCTATALPVTPLVNISNGNQWTCTGGVYTQSAGAGGVASWGTITGTLSNQADLQAALGGKVGTGTTVNGHALSGNVTVAYADLGVVPAADLPNPGASSLGGVQSKDCSSVGLLQKINTDGTVTCAALSAINPQAGTYQVLAGDFSGFKTITAASGTFTVTLVASGSQPANGQYITVINYGSGVVTIARSGQNINGGTSSITLAAASATAPTSVKIYSDGTNYFATTAGGSTGGGSNITSGAYSSLPGTCAHSGTASDAYWTTDSFYSFLCTATNTFTPFIDGKQAVLPGAASTWTLVNGNSGTATKADSKGAVTLSTTSAVLGLESLLKAVPAAPYTKILAIRFVGMQGSSANIFGCGVGWASGTATTSSVQELRLGIFTNGFSFEVAHWSNYTYTSAVDDFIAGFGIGHSSSATTWIKLADDNTNRTVSYSNDGVNFIQLFSGARATPFTPTHYGVFCGAQTGAGAFPYNLTLLSDN